MKTLNRITTSILLIGLASQVRAEPTMRFDDRSDKNKDSSSASSTAPARPAYYDSYKKWKSADTPAPAAPAPQNASTTPPPAAPMQGISPEQQAQALESTQKQMQQQYQNAMPASVPQPTNK